MLGMGGEGCVLRLGQCKIWIFFQSNDFLVVPLIVTIILTELHKKMCYWLEVMKCSMFVVCTNACTTYYEATCVWGITLHINSDLLVSATSLLHDNSSIKAAIFVGTRIFPEIQFRPKLLWWSVFSPGNDVFLLRSFANAPIKMNVYFVKIKCSTWL